MGSQIIEMDLPLITVVLLVARRTLMEDHMEVKGHKVGIAMALPIIKMRSQWQLFKEIFKAISKAKRKDA